MGAIDGSGEQWWVHDLHARPRLFHMQYVQNVTFSGVTLKNTGAMTLVFNSPCSSAKVSGVTIQNPAVGETDGIDMGCDGALIEDVHVINGDDSICMKSGARNVLVRNCTVENGEPYPEAKTQGLAGGLVLGTSDNNNMSNVTYVNCSVSGALAGVRVKFRPTQAGTVHGITFENIHIVRPVAYAVDMLLDSNHLRAIDDLAAVDVGDITLRNIHGALGTLPDGTYPRAVARFRCTSADQPCNGIVLEHFNVTGYRASDKYPVPCEWTNAHGSGEDVYPTACAPASWSTREGQMVI